MTIKNVIHIGAAGNLGAVVLQELLASDFNVKVLRREGSKTTFPEGVAVIDADFSSKKSLVAALQDVDAVVSTITNLAALSQHIVIDAAIEAGVQRFIPSDFGANPDHPVSRHLPIFADKIKIQEYLIEKSKTTAITWTSVATNPFLDWGLEFGFLLGARDGKLRIVGTGDDKFSATALDSIARSVVGILHHPDETRNRTVFIDDIKISQNRILALAKQVAPEKEWDVQHIDIDKDVAEAQEKWNKGIVDPSTIIPLLLKASVAKESGGCFEKTDNELLGLKPKDEQYIVDVLKRLLK